jgi:heme/copper-type cytochrome/quinol oxidase subunit 2
MNVKVLPKDENAHDWQTEESEPDEEGYITITYTCLNGCGTVHEESADEPHHRIDPDYVKQQAEKDSKLPVWLIVIICVAGVIIVAGVVMTIYFAIFKKKNKAESYKYKFNTLKKK